MDSYTHIPYIVRGERRQTLRVGVKDRRSRPRTPGAFKFACDAAFEAMRRTEQNVSTQTKVPLQAASNSL